MLFEVFEKRMTPLAKATTVTIQNSSMISLNKAATAGQTTRRRWNCSTTVTPRS
jgi:hypothetical protein